MPSKANYLVKALADLGNVGPTARVLDFGCGKGALVAELQSLGFDAHGCDQDPYWDSDQSGRLRPIERHPYRLPFADNSFDAVVSTSVLEHAQNKEECFREIHRVLRPNGLAIHMFPSKWYLPSEPHIYVPLANYFWPSVPRVWLAFWALVGVRNEFQAAMPWQKVADSNADYCRTGLAYWTTREYDVLSRRVFGNVDWPMGHFIAHGGGGYNDLVKRLPFQDIWGRIGRQFRYAVLVNRKRAGQA